MNVSTTRSRNGAPPNSFLLLACLMLMSVVSSGVAEEDLRDLEPTPPWVFFGTPDAVTEAEIYEEMVRGFGDLNQVVSARDRLVHRYGVWSATVLGRELQTASNQPRTWNSALTAYALRDTLGNARELWPLAESLVRLVNEGGEPYERAFASLALGSFHGPRFVPDPPRDKDPLVVRVPEERARAALESGLAALGRRVTDGHPHVEVAAILALAKSGDPGARELLCAETCLQDSAHVEPRMAALLAMGLLPGQNDEAIFLSALQHGERRIRRAAALGASLQALLEQPPAWTRSPRRVRRALLADPIRDDLEDGAEAVFARGVFAAVDGDAKDWRELLRIATTPSTQRETKRAAAQALLFCREPWFPGALVERLGQAKSLDPVVVAAFLAYLGLHATPEGVDIAHKYLSTGSLSPRGKSEWDVRYHAALGLLRALVQGRVTQPALRARMVEALEAGASRGLPAGPFRDALRGILELERRPILEDPRYLVPERRLEELEQTFEDPHGLLARDLRDVAVVRLNDMLPLVFNMNSRRPGAVGDRDKTEIPRRFLQAAVKAYPYFSRLEFLSERGRRAPSTMPRTNDPSREVRGP